MNLRDGVLRCERRPFALRYAAKRRTKDGLLQLVGSQGVSGLLVGMCRTDRIWRRLRPSLRVAMTDAGFIRKPFGLNISGSSAV